MYNDYIIKNYQSWEGKNIFLCSGRIMCGPAFYAPIITFFLINIPYVLFLIFPVWYLSCCSTIFLFILAIIILLATNILLGLSSISDPGALPRQNSPFINNHHLSLKNVDAEKFVNKFIILKGCKVKLKFCPTCLIYRPPRTSHCEVCDNCVERFDHHCPWIGNCVGIRNYKYFYIFINILAIALLYVLGICSAFIITYILIEKEYVEMIGFLFLRPGIIISFMLIIYSGVFIVFDFTLCGYHHYLVCKNETTNENYKEYYLETHSNPHINPINFLENCFRRLFSKMHKRFFKPEKPYIEPEVKLDNIALTDHFKQAQPQFNNIDSEEDEKNDTDKNEPDIIIKNDDTDKDTVKLEAISVNSPNNSNSLAQENKPEIIKFEINKN